MKYIGNGAFVPGIPARDLTADEVKLFGGEKMLAETGLYEIASDTQIGSQQSDDKKRNNK